MKVLSALVVVSAIVIAWDWVLEQHEKGFER